MYWWVQFILISTYYHIYQPLGTTISMKSFFEREAMKEVPQNRMKNAEYFLHGTKRRFAAPLLVPCFSKTVRYTNKCSGNFCCIYHSESIAINPSKSNEILKKILIVFFSANMTSIIWKTVRDSKNPLAFLLNLSLKGMQRKIASKSNEK